MDHPDPLASGAAPPPGDRARPGGPDGSPTAASPEGRAAGPAIRRLTAGDAAAVAGLSADLGYPTPVDDMADRLGALLADPGHALFGAEAEDGKLVGWVQVCARLLLIDPPSAFIEGLVVGPGARRRGVGRALMAAAEEWARSRGLGTIRLRSGAARSDAHAFYRAIGYREGKAALGFEKPPALG